MSTVSLVYLYMWRCLRSLNASCNIIIYIIKEGLSVCLCVCMYPSSAHSFDPIGMKLGMDTPWDTGSDVGLI